MLGKAADAFGTILKYGAPQAYMAGRGAFGEMQAQERQSANQKRMDGAFATGDLGTIGETALRTGDFDAFATVSRIRANEADRANAQTTAATTAETQKFEQYLAAMQNLSVVPMEQRGTWLQQNRALLEQPLGGKIDALLAQPELLTDENLSGHLGAVRARLGQGPAQPEPGKVIGNALVDPVTGETRATIPDERPWWAGEGQVDPAMLAYREAGRSTTTVNNNMPTQKGETKFQEGMASQAVGTIGEIRQGGADARQDLSNLATMELLLGEIDYTGLGGETLLNIQRAGQVLGLDIPDVAPKEAMQRLSAEMGLSLKENLPGPMSDADREFLLSIPPNINLSKEANAAMLFIMRKRAEHKQAVASSWSQRAAEIRQQTGAPPTYDDFSAWETESQTQLSSAPIFPPDVQAALLADLGSVR